MHGLVRICVYMSPPVILMLMSPNTYYELRVVHDLHIHTFWPIAGWVHPIILLLEALIPLCSCASHVFEGEHLVVHDRFGYGALVPVGDCIWQHVRNHVDGGEMPSEGSICDSPFEQFDDVCPESLPSPVLLTK